MKIFFAHATEHTFKYEAYEAIQSSQLYQKYQITLPQENGYQPPMPRESILEYDMLIAECSFPSTGEGIELGWMHSVGKPILCLYRSDAKPSGALHNVANEIAVYEDFNDMLNKIEDFIKKYEPKN